MAPLWRRMSVTQSTRDIVFKAWNGRCVYCRSVVTKRHYTVDHMVPVSKNGNHRPYNLVLACESCNKKRGNIRFTVFLDSCEIKEDRKATLEKWYAKSVVQHIIENSDSNPERSRANQLLGMYDVTGCAYARPGRRETSPPIIKVVARHKAEIATITSYDGQWMHMYVVRTEGVTRYKVLVVEEKFEVGENGNGSK